MSKPAPVSCNAQYLPEQGKRQREGWIRNRIPVVKESVGCCVNKYWLGFLSTSPHKKLLHTSRLWFSWAIRCGKRSQDLFLDLAYLDEVNCEYFLIQSMLFILSSLVMSEREHVKIAIANVWKHQVVANKKHPLDDDEAIFSQPQTSADKKVTFAFMTIHCFYTAPPVEQWCPISLLLYLFIACNVSLIQLGKGGTCDVLYRHHKSRWQAFLRAHCFEAGSVTKCAF